MREGNLSHEKIEGNCRYCGEYTQLCEAHIVPKAFFRAIKKLDGSKFLYVHDGKHDHESTTPMGFWDNHILCATCDNKLGVYDNNFFTYLTKTNFDIYRKELFPCHYYQLNMDSETYLNTKLFFASLLYRASISQIGFSRNVNLGNKYELLMKDFIKRKYADIKELVVIPMKLYSFKTDPRQAIEGIYRNNIDGVNGYSIILYGFKFWIKVDQRPVPKSLDLFSFHEGEIFIPEDEYEKTSDYRAAVELAKQFHNKK